MTINYFLLFQPNLGSLWILNLFQPQLNSITLWNTNIKDTQKYPFVKGYPSRKQTVQGAQFSLLCTSWSFLFEARFLFARGILAFCFASELKYVGENHCVTGGIALLGLYLG